MRAHQWRPPRSSHDLISPDSIQTQQKRLAFKIYNSPIKGRTLQIDPHCRPPEISISQSYLFFSIDQRSPTSNGGGYSPSQGTGGWCSLTPQERGVPAWPINGGRGVCAGCSLSWGRGLVQLVTLDGGFALLDSVPGLVFLPPLLFCDHREGRKEWC